MRRGIQQNWWALLGAISLTAILIPATATADGWNPNSRAGNIESITNTRHNLTQAFTGPGGSPSPGVGAMNSVRNNYQEVCVYCHTPHGANSAQVIQGAPIWNRTVNTTGYQIYDKERTLNRPIGQPGPNSLTCLSCHDGTISIDSIINMPGSGGYSKDAETNMDTAFLNAWGDNSRGRQGGVAAGDHFVLGQDPYTYAENPSRSGQCVLCHNSNLGEIGIPDYTVFALGTDLRNDHAIGILFPFDIAEQPGVDFFKPNLEYTNASGNGRMAVFDVNGNGWPDKEEPRLYDSGEGYEVECASCHDPHGVPTSGNITDEFIPSFLRVSNGNANTLDGTPSGLCLTCHIK